MPCETYNVIKEGDLRSIPSPAVEELDFDAINALYDDDVSSVAVTVSGAPATFGLLAEFGEAYDFCHVNYYTDEATLSNISIKYGTASGVEETAAVALVEPGLYRGTIDSFARFVELRHTVSGTAAALHQLQIIALRNDTLGFGETQAAQTEHFNAPHATVDVLSAGVNRIPVFNHNHFDDVARVAVVPTFTKADNYLHLATSLSGTYYGIDAFGIGQPGPNPIPHEDDPMTAAVLHPQWRRVAKAQAGGIVPTAEGLLFNYGFDSYIDGGPTGETTGIISKDFFTATSFTAEVEIKFVGINGSASELYSQRDFYFILANGFPLEDAGYTLAFTGDGRRGTSTAGITVRTNRFDSSFNTANAKFIFRVADGTETTNPFSSSIENTFALHDPSGYTSNPAFYSEQGYITMDAMEDNLSTDMADLTSAAGWHKWVITYDHLRQDITAYVDNVFLGTSTMRGEPFQEGCKLFIGMEGQAGIEFLLRNFKIRKDVLYSSVPRSLSAFGGVPSATVSGVAGNVAKLIDGDDSTAYVGPAPTSSTTVRIDLDQPYDVVNYTIRQRDFGSGISAFGKTYYPDVARSVLVDFGGKRLEVHLLPNTGGTVTRTPTFSGTAPTVSGIDYIEWSFLTYDEATQDDSALVIEELTINTAEFNASPSPALVSDSTKIPWIEGRWHNVRSMGTSNSLGIRSPGYIRADYWPFPQYLQVGVDYGFSSATNGREFSSVYDYHHAEALFSSPGGTGAGDYTQWHSDTQATLDSFFIWRRFTEERAVSLLTFNSSTFITNNAAGSFKFQYLRKEGNPNVEADWINIAPLAVPHPKDDTSGDRLYQTYKNYLISNNDGEFYTNYFAIPNDSDGGVTSFSVGGQVNLGARILEDVIPLGYGQETVSRNSGGSNALSAIVELDSVVRTQGIRLVVRNPVFSTAGASMSRFALESFKIFCADGSGSYTSPVFDTGTAQNTERLRASLRIPPETEASVFVRSSDEQPASSYSTDYEIWRSFGRKGDVNVTPPTRASSDPAFAIPYEGKIYYMFESGPFVYDPVSDVWTQENGGYPTSASQGDTSTYIAPEDGQTSTATDILADDSVINHATLVGDEIYLAARTTGTTRIPRFLRLRFSLPDEGWVALKDNRPPATEDAVMSSHGARIYFFNQDGSTYYWDIELSNWVLISAALPNFGGNRSNMASARYKDQQYFFGGATATQAATRFDYETELFYSVAAAPKQILSHYAVAVEEEEVIYVFPGTSSVRTAMKYFPEEDRWEVTESLMWDRDKYGPGYGRGSVYFYYDGEIIKLGDDDFGEARTLVRRPPWESGKLPDFRDAVWGERVAITNFPWREIDTFGELLPQKRFFQFRVELRSFDWASSPSLDGVNVVVPQRLPVLASGTADLFMRIGVAEDSVFRAWYSGEARDFASAAGDYSILTATSSDGLSWNAPTLASGVYTVAYPTDGYGVRSPWVIKNSEADYQVWYERRALGDIYIDEDPEIWYVQTSNPDDFSLGNLAQLVIVDGVVSETAGGVRFPTVVKEDATTYKMWFTGYDTNDSGGTATTPRIFYTESTDGITWTGHQKVLSEGEDTIHQYDTLGVLRASVLLEEGVYRMWYSGLDAEGVSRILYRESTDGISWGALLLSVDVGFEGTSDILGVQKPTVTKDTNGSYYLYYFGVNSSGTVIIRAESPDGLSWSAPELAFPRAGLEGKWDAINILDVHVLVDRNPVIPGEVITVGKVKLHNEGASL